MSNPQDAEGWLFAAAKVDYCTAIEKQRAAMLWKPRLFIDGDMWCALLGDNIQDGVAGFGKSPELALLDFDASFSRRLK